MAVALIGVLWAVAASQSTWGDFVLIMTAHVIQIFICASRACSKSRLRTFAQIIMTLPLVLTYVLILFIYALVSHLRHGRGYVWWKSVEDLKDFRLPALTHKPRGSDGRFMDGSDGGAAKVFAATPLIPPGLPEV